MFDLQGDEMLVFWIVLLVVFIKFVFAVVKCVFCTMIALSFIKLCQISPLFCVKNSFPQNYCDMKPICKIFSTHDTGIMSVNIT